MPKPRGRRPRKGKVLGEKNDVAPAAALEEASADNATDPSESTPQNGCRINMSIGQINGAPEGTVDQVVYNAPLCPCMLVPQDDPEPQTPFMLQARNYQSYRLSSFAVRVNSLMTTCGGSSYTVFYLPANSKLPTSLSMPSLSCLQYSKTVPISSAAYLRVPGATLNIVQDGWCPVKMSDHEQAPGRVVIVQHGAAMNPYQMKAWTAKLLQADVEMTVGFRNASSQNLKVTQANESSSTTLSTTDGLLTLQSKAVRSHEIRSMVSSPYARAATGGFGSTVIEVVKMATDVAAASLPAPFSWFAAAGSFFLRQMTGGSARANDDIYALFASREDAEAGQALVANNVVTPVTKDFDMTTRIIINDAGLPTGIVVNPTRATNNGPTPQHRPLKNLTDGTELTLIATSSNVQYSYTTWTGFMTTYTTSAVQAGQENFTELNITQYAGQQLPTVVNPWGMQGTFTVFILLHRQERPLRPIVAFNNLANSTLTLFSDTALTDLHFLGARRVEYANVNSLDKAAHVAGMFLARVANINTTRTYTAVPIVLFDLSSGTLTVRSRPDLPFQIANIARLSTVVNDAYGPESEPAALTDWVEIKKPVGAITFRTALSTIPKPFIGSCAFGTNSGAILALWKALGHAASFDEPDFGFRAGYKSGHRQFELSFEKSPELQILELQIQLAKLQLQLNPPTAQDELDSCSLPTQADLEELSQDERDEIAIWLNN